MSAPPDPLVGSADSAFRNFFVQLASPQTLTQVIVILSAVLLALAGGQAMRRRRRRQSELAEPASWVAHVIEGVLIVAPILLALVLLLAGRGLLALFGEPVGVVETALQLTTVLLLVRIGVYGLRLLLGSETWFDAWESRIATILWLMIGFELVGWFDKFEGTLEHINLIPGRSTFTLWALLKGVVVVTVFVFVTTLIARTIERRLMRLDAIALSTRIGISKFSYFLLVGIGVLLGINAAGVDVTTLNVLTGAIGLGLGFGLQTIAGNFVSGFVLLMDKSIKPGDVISFTGHTGTSTENFGWVQELRGRYVVVRDRDGVETLVPNQNLITNSVINWSYSDQRVRIRLPVMVSYDDDPELALKVLLEAARDHPRILREPHPVTRLMAFEDYGIRLEVRFWIADPMNGVNNVRSDVNRAIWRMFRENGITIPVAQREIRVVEPQAARQRRALLTERDVDPD
ncbi:MAG TPA: mechanosensitive ion channel domain-containing protein [Steroidobacteraceae bacterium]|nr:mechanosensitive ion channel domain-containing protein [Steroidobacteraceae bacterium]